jgi:hypothetical protein
MRLTVPVWNVTKKSRREKDKKGCHDVAAFEQ